MTIVEVSGEVPVVADRVSPYHRDLKGRAGAYPSNPAAQ
jgi:hypothetical protein